MKKLALLALVALEICVCACGNNPPTSNINTVSNASEWEAKLTGGAGEDSLLNFVTQFSAGENGGTLDVTGFNFINQSVCFPSNLPTANGTGHWATNASDQVTGTMTFTVTGDGTTLTLNGSVSGTSSGSTSTTGNLTNGVVQGTWSLTSSITNCVPDASTPPTGPFLMCQGSVTCTVP